MEQIRLSLLVVLVLHGIITSSNHLYALFNIFASYGYGRTQSSTGRARKKSSVHLHRAASVCLAFYSKNMITKFTRVLHNTNRMQKSKTRRSHIRHWNKAGRMMRWYGGGGVGSCISQACIVHMGVCAESSRHRVRWICDTKQNAKCWLAPDTLLICGVVLADLTLSRSQAQSLARKHFISFFFSSFGIVRKFSIHENDAGNWITIAYVEWKGESRRERERPASTTTRKSQHKSRATVAAGCMAGYPITTL